VEEDKVAYAVGFGDYADAQWNVKMISAHLVWDAYFTTIGDATFGYYSDIAEGIVKAVKAGVRYC
jgi:subtilisin